MASDLSCAHLLELTDQPPSLIHVSSAEDRGRRLDGVVHHRRSIARPDFLIVRGIPCTGAARTIVDCAGSLPVEELERLLMAADASGKLNRRRLEELLAAAPGRRGTRALRHLVGDDPVDTRSENERRMLRICRRFGVAEPLVNHPIPIGDRTFIADFCWPELRLIVEADSWRWHGGRLATESDTDRGQLLSAAGWKVVHFTRNQIRHSPEIVATRLLTLTQLSVATTEQPKDAGGEAARGP